MVAGHIRRTLAVRDVTVEEAPALPVSAINGPRIPEGEVTRANRRHVPEGIVTRTVAVPEVSVPVPHITSPSTEGPVGAVGPAGP